jgi:6-phosphogluconolactonase
MKQNFVYIGTYSGARSHGIYVSRFDSDKGDLGSPELAAEMKNPSFLALAPSGKFLYAVGENEDFAGKSSGSVAAFRIRDSSGKLALLNEQPSEGGGPCHVALDSGGKCVMAANYGSGSICALPVNPDGSLGAARSAIQHHGSSVDAGRQSGPHAHFIAPAPGNRFVLTCDLGLDKVLVYRFEPLQASLSPNDPPSASITPGAGPRHLAFHPNGNFVYVINELNSTLTACSYDPAMGVLKVLQSVSTLPEAYKGQNYCSEVQVHRSGKFLYGANRGHDSLAIFAIDPKSGRLTNIGYQSVLGKTPRHFAIDPTGKWLLAENQDSDKIVVFRIDSSTGKLAETGKSIQVGSPVCAVFAPISF